MSRMRIIVKDKERRVVLKKTWIEHGYMYITISTGEIFRRSLKYFPTDRHGWEPFKSLVVTPPSPPNPAVMHPHSYARYCAAYSISYAPNKEFSSKAAYYAHLTWQTWNASFASDIVFG